MNFKGMWLDSSSNDLREALPPGKGEKAGLAEYLDRYRMTFELKCEGLTAEQLATRSVPPSTMSLLGITRHLARVEHFWTRRVLEGSRRASPALPHRRRPGLALQPRHYPTTRLSETRGRLGAVRLLRECIDGRTGQ